MLPVAINERFRFYRYNPGHRFRRHKDGFEKIRDLTSQLSFLIYLNDDFVGGEAIFREYHGKGESRYREELVIQPEIGDALLFYHRIWHEGAEVTQGTKYVMRSDVLCYESSMPKNT